MKGAWAARGAPLRVGTSGMAHRAWSPADFVHSSISERARIAASTNRKASRDCRCWALQTSGASPTTQWASSH